MNSKSRNKLRIQLWHLWMMSQLNGKKGRGGLAAVQPSVQAIRSAVLLLVATQGLRLVLMKTV